MRKYLLFAGYEYDAATGWKHCAGAGDTEQQLIEHLETLDGQFDWAHIVCLESMAIVRLYLHGHWLSTEEHEEWKQAGLRWA